MDAFEAPRGDGPSDEPDLVVKPGPLPMVAGVLLMLGGFCTGMSGVQLKLYFTMYGWLGAVPYVLAVVGFLACVVGAASTRARLWASVVGVLAAGSCGLLIVIWNMYAITHGLFSVLAVLAMVPAGLAVLAVPLSLPVVLKVHRARSALYT